MHGCRVTIVGLVSEGRCSPLPRSYISARSDAATSTIVWISRSVGSYYGCLVEQPGSNANPKRQNSALQDNYSTPSSQEIGYIFVLSWTSAPTVNTLICLSRG